MDWHREKDSWPNADTSLFLDLEGVQWHVQRTGSGPTLLLLHGSGATTHSFNGLITELSQSYELFVPDLPGHGFTSVIRRKRSSLHNISEALSKLLEHEDFKPTVVIGHSAGAAIAVNMTMQGFIAPKGIISINGAFYPFPGIARQLFPAMAKVLFLNPFVPSFFARSASNKDRVRRLIRSTGSQLTEQQLDYYARAFRSVRHVEGTLAMMANWELEEMDKLLKSLSVPLLQIIGEKDGTVDPDASFSTEKLVPESSRASFADAGHLVHEEHPKEVARKISEFVSKCISNDKKPACAN